MWSIARPSIAKPCSARRWRKPRRNSTTSTPARSSTSRSNAKPKPINLSTRNSSGRIKEATINSGFQNSSIRIADLARPAAKPVFPNIQLNVFLASSSSLSLALGAAVIGDMLNNAVRDPEQISRTLSTEVIGTLPGGEGMAQQDACDERAWARP